MKIGYKDISQATAIFSARTKIGHVVMEKL